MRILPSGWRLIYAFCSSPTPPPTKKTSGYCWQTLRAAIWPDLVAQEGASNANGEAHVGARGRSPNLASWPIQLGFANSIRPFLQQ